MTFREAATGDILQMQVIRNLVKENTLSNPALVTDDDVRVFITERGKGWVCETDKVIVGFAIADLRENNIWALFVHPGYDKKGIGKTLHALMLDWYFGKTEKTVWLGTGPGTRAAVFYKKQGWQQVETNAANEIKFEMTKKNWRSKK